MPKQKKPKRKPNKPPKPTLTAGALKALASTGEITIENGKVVIRHPDPSDAGRVVACRFSVEQALDFANAIHIAAVAAWRGR